MNYVKLFSRIFFAILIYSTQVESMSDLCDPPSVKKLGGGEEVRINLDIENQFFIRHLNIIEQEIFLLNGYCAKNQLDMADDLRISLRGKVKYIENHLRSTEEDEFTIHKDRFIILQNKYNKILSMYEAQREEEQMLAQKKIKWYQKIAKNIMPQYFNHGAR